MTLTERLAGWYPGEQVVLVDQADEISRRFDMLGDQRPATCGAYALGYLLPALGFERHAGHDLAAEDYLAHLAGVVVEDREVAPSRAVAERVARGELSEADALERFAGTWYRYPVRASADPVAQGTSPEGIARAIAIATGGRLVSLPIAGREPDGQVALDEDRFGRLFDLVAANVGRWNLHAILNYESDQLLNPRSPAYTIDRLRVPGGWHELPNDDWGVGHFSGLAGLWRRPDGERWVLLFDTYKERGFAGYQPQPAELVRRALVRTDGRGGGVLIILPREHLDATLAAVREARLEPRMWSNGSPRPDDFEWSLGR